MRRTHLDGGDVEVLVEADRRRVSSVDGVQFCLHAFHVLFKELHLEGEAKIHHSYLKFEKTDHKFSCNNKSD